MNEDYDECRICGAVVANLVKHRTWHEALERIAPGVEAEANRLAEARRAELRARRGQR